MLFWQIPLDTFLKIDLIQLSLTYIIYKKLIRVLLQVNSQSLEDTQYEYILQKYT